MRVGGVAVNRIDEWKFADEHPDDAKIREANYETTSVYGFGHPLYYDNVIRVLRGECEPETDGRETCIRARGTTAPRRSGSPPAR